MAQRENTCRDCEKPAGLDRRQFVAALGKTALGASALAAGTLSLRPHTAYAAPSRASTAESAVGRLYESLSDEQKKEVCIGWDDDRRTNISANWHVTKANVGGLSADQQKIVHDVLRGVTSEDGYEKFLRQMDADHGGIDNYAVAIVGDPAALKDGGDGKCQFMLTGRHLTLRADGDTTPGAAFGGPIVYGHGESTPGKNYYFYQTQRANELFSALDPDQRKKALLARAPEESAVQLREEGASLPGIGGGDLKDDQRELLGKVLADILSPYRKEDVDEVMDCLKAGGGLEKLHMAFYQQGDLEDDGVWDVWRVESPTVVCHFRGAPHVHAYINIAKK
jgi:hypothetical protein